MTYQVTLTELADTKAAHRRTRVAVADLGRAIGAGIAELYSHAGRIHATPTGPPQVAYPGDFGGAEVDLDLFLPVAATASTDDVVQLPGGPMARTFHHGRYEDIGAAHRALAEWIDAKGLHPAGPPREIYLTGPDAVSDPALYLTEIVVPLERS